MVQYDWSKLDPEWTHVDGRLMRGNAAGTLVTNVEAYAGGTGGWFAQFMSEAKAQLAQCRVDASSQQRKHEATHGWRNPPSIYEEDR